jgi:hypothetical protein
MVFGLLLAVVTIGLLLGSAMAQPDPLDTPRGVLALDSLGNKSVQKELKLTTEQVSKIKQLDKRMEAKMEKAFEESVKQKLSDKEGNEKLEAVAKEAEAETAKLVKESFEPEQAKRFKQIERQLAGLSALTYEDVALELKLTDDQKNEMKKIVDTITKETRDLLKGKSGEKRKAAREKGRALRQDALDKATSLLSADQKKQWKEMLGTPFEWKPDRPSSKPPTSPPKDSSPDFSKDKKKG